MRGKAIFPILLVMTGLTSPSLEGADSLGKEYDSIAGQDFFDIEDASQESLAEQKQRPFRLWGGYDYIFPAKFKDTDDYDGEKIQYSMGEVTLAFPLCYSICNREAIVFIGGYRDTEIRWNENPFFDQTHFPTARVGVAGLTNRFDNWLWQGSVILNVDVKHFDLERNLTWDLLLWGRYQYNDCVGVHVGIYAETGMMVDHVFPVIGFDWLPCEKWKINAVFPTDISSVYSLTDTLSLVGAMRFFNTRNRVGKNENLERAVVTYYNSGLEMALMYENENGTMANIHGGYTTGGRLKVADSDYSNRQHFRFKGSPYYGGEVKVSF